MIFGNWVAIHKGFTKHLPIDRPYTELEAVYSLSVDIDNKRSVSVAGYSKLWGWSRNKINRFLSNVGVEFFYPESLGKKQNQRAEAKGQIRDRSWTDDGQIRYIIDKALQRQKDRSRTDQGQIKDSTIDPNPNPKKKTTIPKPENVTDQTWSDFLIHRKTLKASITQTVINSFSKQAELAGISLEDALIESVSRGWRGFKAEWYKKPRQKKERSLEEIFLKPEQNNGFKTVDSQDTRLLD